MGSSRFAWIIAANSSVFLPVLRYAVQDSPRINVLRAKPIFGIEALCYVEAHPSACRVHGKSGRSS